MTAVHRDHNLDDELLDALTDRDADARADRALALLDAGANAAATSSGQNALSILLGAHDELGPRDGEVFARLVEAGANVNYRERRGDLIMKLIVCNSAEEEDKRELYDAMFSSPRP